ncbi:MAG TPA: YbaY family lipoprotein [Pseudomonadales bacterium]
MRAASLILLVLLTACAGSQPPESPQGTLSGTVSYRERIALDSNTVLQVTLEDVSRADAPSLVISEYREPVNAQVPVPFALHYDPQMIQANHRYTLRAKLLSADGAVLFISDTHIPVLTEGHPAHDVHIALVAVSRPVRDDAAADNKPGRTLVFECQDADFVVRTGAGEVALWLGDDYSVLSQVPSASGHQYQEGAITLWMKGDEATLKTPDITVRGCRNNAQRAIWEGAKLRGVDFRATGNEPGWALEIDNEGNITLLMENGQTRVSAPTPPANKQGTRTQYTATDNAHTLQATLEQKRCIDSMAEIIYGTSVIILIDGNTYQGCGNWLQ